MLVLDEDRNNYYKYIYNHLSDNGFVLILTMGDGIEEYSSGTSKAFENIIRVHQESNIEIKVAATSCRVVSFNTLLNEVKKGGFDTVEYGITEINNHFDTIMYIIIKKH